MLPPPLPFPPQEDIPAREPRIRHTPNRLIFITLRLRSAQIPEVARTQVDKGLVASRCTNSQISRSQAVRIKSVGDGAHLVE